MYSHPYSQITVETEFDNPIYETGVSCLLCTPGCLPLLQIHPPALWGVPVPVAHVTTLKGPP